MRRFFARVALVVFVVGLAPLPAPLAASRAPIRARHAIIGSASALASQAGIDILEQGGTAIDAAVAVGFALAVVHPEAGNIGGGGVMVIRFADGRATTIDYRETAPAKATRDMFLDTQGNAVADRSQVGPLAAGVPGSVAGLCLAHGKYGKLPLAAVVAPAIRLAEAGFEVSAAFERSLDGGQKLLSRFPGVDTRLHEEWPALCRGRSSRATRSRAHASAHRRARSRRVLSGAGRRSHRGGDARSGGLIRKSDLAAYKAIEREPVRGTYRGYDIIAMPPVSSGGVALIEALNILEGFPLKEYGLNSSKTMHLVAETTRRVYADRSEWLGDPAFFKVPVQGLLSKRYAETLRASIDPEKATPSATVKPGRPAGFESEQTTHYSVVDEAGTAVSTTTTINGGFGNGQVVAGAGFLLNNEMDDFSAKPGTPNMFGLVGGEANAVAPGKRMLSSMTPSIVTKDGKALLVVGSPGGSRIITTVLQVVMNVLDHGMNVQEAVDAPRFHHQWLPDEIRIERQGFPLDVRRALEGKGHKIVEGDDMGDVHAIWIDPATGVRYGASDPRRDGRTIGY